MNRFLFFAALLIAVFGSDDRALASCEDQYDVKQVIGLLDSLSGPERTIYLGAFQAIAPMQMADMSVVELNAGIGIKKDGDAWEFYLDVCRSERGACKVRMDVEPHHTLSIKDGCLQRNGVPVTVLRASKEKLKYMSSFAHGILKRTESGALHYTIETHDRSGFERGGVFVGK